MPNAPKREKREKKLLVKEEVRGESTAKSVFQIKTPKKKTMNANIRKQTMEMQREIDVVAMIRGGNGDNGDSDGRNSVLGFDFGGRTRSVLS